MCGDRKSSGLAALRGGGFQLWHWQIFLFLSQMWKTLQLVPLQERHACWWQLLWALPTHTSFTVTISPTVLLFCLFCHLLHPKPFFSSPPYVHLLPTSCTHTTFAPTVFRSVWSDVQTSRLEGKRVCGGGGGGGLDVGEGPRWGILDKILILNCPNSYRLT